MCRRGEDVISKHFMAFLEEIPFMAVINTYNADICLQAARTHPNSPNRLTLTAETCLIVLQSNFKGKII